MARRRDQQGGPDGFVLLDKPSLMTSHDVVGGVRRWAGTRRVGHAGTLDPAATGLLLLGVGKATRLLGALSLEGKTYESTFVLGQSTSTDDAQGQVCGQLPPPPLPGGVHDPLLVQALAGLSGPIEQVPPQVSAVKVAGQRAYARARAGLTTPLRPRSVVVEQFTVSQVQTLGSGLLRLQVLVRCSSGTYIRSLARDLGVALGTVGHVETLRRTQIGPFAVQQALGWEQVVGPNPAPVEQALVPMAQVVRTCMPAVQVDGHQRLELAFGRSLELEQLPNWSGVGTLEEVQGFSPQRSVAVLDVQEQVVAVAVVRGQRLQPQAVFVQPETASPAS